MTDIESLLYQNHSYKEGIEAFGHTGNTLLYGMSGSQKTFMYSHAMKLHGMIPTIIVVHDKEHKELWQRDLACLLPTSRVLAFPHIEQVTFSTIARSMESQAKQMEALCMLKAEKNVIVIADAEEVSQFVVSPEELANMSITLACNNEIARDELLERLVAIGYERVDQVEQRGHFAVRGDIIDIYSVNNDLPYRIELFGDEIDTIRTFEVETQRSVTHIDDCMITPIKLANTESKSSLLSYAQQGLIIFDEPVRIQESLKKYLKEDSTHHTFHYDWHGLTKTITSPTQVAFSFMQQRSIGLSGFSPIGIQGKAMTSFERQVPLLMDEIKQWHTLQYQVVLVMHNLQRREGIERALLEENIKYKSSDIWTTETGIVTIWDGLLTDGFEFPHSRFVVITEGNIYGQQKKRLRRKAEKGQDIKYFTDLSIGDYVVHTVHGIGKYLGLKTIETEGIHRDYIEIAYAGTDRLFLPADNLDQLQKYIGNEGDTPRIHKMGGRDWQRIKAKAQKSIDELAERLVKIYAQREISPGFAFLPDQPWQQEFEEAFPYEETEDQLRATAEIKASMEQPIPMDRLLCGDVGFGKTEVAMRAVFKAVMSGKQVAVLVPTTVLAQQHYQTFLHRFSPFSIRVEVMNRFKSLKERKTIIQATKDGQVDILIGTHSLLNKKIAFKDLGMLVVDEEQRFGVAQKEKWKSWAHTIDVLTLSATPIPRTLHMSLVGVREMSVITTPPEDRVPIQTYVVEYDMSLIVDAIRRELQRGGQVYFVYNRVASIDHMAELLEGALPDLRLAIAHGQMLGTEMEHIMTDFYEGHYDLLLCTSIIETGLDIPNANTIIVYDADHLGLSQLYQMRGRVGRSHRRAYAYFLYRPDKVLTEAAEKRLKAIEEFTELGAGFKLAMRDLEIRGAGNLLGAQQHGNIASVGFAMYCTMLEEAISKVQNKEVTEEVAPPPDPIIDLGVDAFIDDAYIKDSARKISIYQRLLYIKTVEALDDLMDEMIDRFGTPTEPVNRLLKIAMIKERARLLGIHSIIHRDNTLIIQWYDDSKMTHWDMASVSESMWKRIRLLDTKPTSAHVILDGMTTSIITMTDNVLTELERRIDASVES